ncbi:hypothetical protein WG66_009723 [Moniliophthora roreri]|nr:hypothetical protein WG66_009723 [Moniliophthora roreri]
MSNSAAVLKRMCSGTRRPSKPKTSRKRVNDLSLDHSLSNNFHGQSDTREKQTTLLVAYLPTSHLP